MSPEHIVSIPKVKMNILEQLSISQGMIRRERKRKRPEREKVRVKKRGVKTRREDLRRRGI